MRAASAKNLYVALKYTINAFSTKRTFMLWNFYARQMEEKIKLELEEFTRAHIWKSTAAIWRIFELKYTTLIYNYSSQIQRVLGILVELWVSEGCQATRARLISFVFIYIKQSQVFRRLKHQNHWDSPSLTGKLCHLDKRRQTATHILPFF